MNCHTLISISNLAMKMSFFYLKVVIRKTTELILHGIQNYLIRMICSKYVFWDLRS